ncbi:calcium ion binding protein [Aureococcus anophagefferens]|nr:calcium ion binding protein [Aureococcus anophagefferens]
MFDSGLDGWTDAFFSLYSESGDRVFHATLDAGATGTERFCLADGCYAASVNGDGLFPEEVSWTLGAVTGGAPTEMSMLFSGGDVQESCATEAPTRAPSSARDAVVATDGSMFYLRNDGGEFVWKPLEEMRIGARTRPALGDVDGDADVDLVLGTAAGRIDYLENARGTFVNMTGRANPFAGVDVGGNHPALVDLDADGRLDLVCGGTDGALRRYTRGDGFFFAPDSSDWFASINEGDDSVPSFADLDGDGDADLVLGGSDGALFYYESQGTPVEPRFVNVLDSPFLGFAVSSHSRPVAADVDGDGYVDLVSPFSSVTFDLDSNDDREYSKPAVGDLNGDGLPDVVVGTKTGHVIYLSSTASAAAPVPLPGVVVGEHASPALGDLDSDGDLDLVVGQEDGRLLFFRNANVTEFQEEDAFASIAVSKHSAPALVDVDGDGLLDLVVGNYYGTLDFYANLGGEVFEILKDQDSPFRDVQVNYWSSPAFHDLDSDGDVDLLVGESTGKIRYFERRGQSFQERFAEDSPVSSFDVGKFSAPAVADVDGDGDADLVVGQQRGAPSVFANGLCVQENPCSGRGVCETSSLFSESTCSCLIGFAGWQCEACQTGYFGTTCDICPQGGDEDRDPRMLDTCGVANSGRSRGTCDDGVRGAGSCDCFDPFTGPSCSNGTCLQDYYFNPFQTYEEAGVIMSCDDRGGLQSTERFADCCVSGERGMDCSVEANNTLEDVRIAPGWWRASIYSTDLYKCGYSGACKDGGWRGLGANASRWKELCADGQEGVMCQVCSSSFHYDMLRNKCVECPGGAVVQGTPLAIFSCALAALLLALATYRCLYDHTDIIFTVAKDLMKDHEAGASDAVIKGGLLFFGSRSHLYDPAAADFDPGGTSSDPGDDAGGVDAPVDPERISIDFSNAAREERDHADGGDVDEEPSCGALSDDEDEDVQLDSAPTCGGAPSRPDVQPIIMEDDSEDEEEEENEQILRIFGFEFNTRNRKNLPMVTLPEAFQTLIEWTSVLELNLVRVLPFDCFMRMDYYRTILIATMTPVFVGLCIFLVGAFYMRRSSNEEDRRSAWIHTMYAFLVLTFLVFPTVSTTCLRYFNCIEARVPLPTFASERFVM